MTDPAEYEPTEHEKQLFNDYNAEQTGDRPAQDQSGSVEASKWRRRLRDVEAERDGLADQLASMRQAEVNRLATSGEGPRLHDADDLDRYGVDRESLIAEDGTINADAVLAAVQTVTDSRPHLRADAPPPRRSDPSQGLGGETPGKAPSWASVLGRD